MALNGIPKIKRVKVRDLLFLSVATWSLCLLAGCGSIPHFVQTPTVSSHIQPTSNNSSTSDENNNGTEISPPLIVVPVGIPPTIDGTLSPGEWDDASVETFLLVLFGANIDYP